MGGMNKPTVIERAFDVARSGRCKSIDEVRAILSREGHFNVDAHLSGGVLRKQLNALIRAPRQVRAEPAATDEPPG